MVHQAHLCRVVIASGATTLARLLPELLYAKGVVLDAMRPSARAESVCTTFSGNSAEVRMMRRLP